MQPADRAEATTASYHQCGFANKYGMSLDDERIAGVRTVSDFKGLVVVKVAEMA